MTRHLSLWDRRSYTPRCCSQGDTGHADDPEISHRRVAALRELGVDHGSGISRRDKEDNEHDQHQPLTISTPYLTFCSSIDRNPVDVSA